jgi:hypothetical protein
LKLVRYEDLVSDTENVLNRIWRRISHGSHLDFQPALPPLEIRERRAELSAEDIQAIRDICGPAARNLGYEI